MTIFPHAQNFAKNIVHNDCATPFFVYVETFVPAFIRMLITTHWLLWDDIVRMIAEEKAGRIRGKGPRSGKHSARTFARNFGTEAERYSHNTLRTLLIITRPIEIVGFAWLLYSATDQFFYDWQTGIMFNSGCFHPAAQGPLQRHRVGGTNVPILPGGAATPLPVLDQDRAGWGSNGFSCSLPEGTYQVFWQANVNGPSGGITGARASLRVVNTIHGPTILGPASDISEGQQATLGMEASFRVFAGGGSCAWELTGPGVPVGLFCSGARVIIQRLA